MADDTFPLQLVGLHEPDQSIEVDDSGHKYAVPLPGVLRVGFYLGDTFLEVSRVKAGNIMDQLEAAKAAGGQGSSQTGSSSSPQGGDTGTGGGQ